MKKVCLLVAAMIMVATSASAQFIEPSEDTDSYWSVWGEWNPSTLSLEEDSESFSESITAFSLGLSRAFNLTESQPLFLEAGGGVQYAFKSDFMKKYFRETGVTFSMLSIKVPMSLIYKFDIPNTSVSLIPNAGLDFRFNILANYSGKALTKDVNLFDKDEIADTWNRFQIGWHIGLKAKIGENFLLGAAYGTDFSEIAKKTHISTATISLGYAF